MRLISTWPECDRLSLPMAPVIRCSHVYDGHSANKSSNRSASSIKCRLHKNCVHISWHSNIIIASDLSLRWPMRRKFLNSSLPSAWTSRFATFIMVKCSICSSVYVEQPQKQRNTRKSVWFSVVAAAVPAAALTGFGLAHFGSDVCVGVRALALLHRSLSMKALL